MSGPGSPETSSRIAVLLPRKQHARLAHQQPFGANTHDENRNANRCVGARVGSKEQDPIQTRPPLCCSASRRAYVSGFQQINLDFDASLGLLKRLEQVRPLKRETDKQIVVCLSVILRMVKLLCFVVRAALLSYIANRLVIEAQTCPADEQKYFPASMLAICLSSPAARDTRCAMRSWSCCRPRRGCAPHRSQT
jgi:hypothetical protein